MSRRRVLRHLRAELGYRFGGWPRRVVVVGCLALAGLSAMSGHRRVAPAPTASVVLATRALVAGTTLTTTDVRVARWPAAQVSRSFFADSGLVIGGSLSGAMTAGEPFTAARLRTHGPGDELRTGQVAVTVTLADSSAAQLIQTGDLVDLVVGSGASSDVSEPVTAAHVLVAGVRVLMVLPALSNSERADISDATRLVIATDGPGSLRVAGAIGAPIVATLRAPH